MLQQLKVISEILPTPSDQTCLKQAPLKPTPTALYVFNNFLKCVHTEAAARGKEVMEFLRLLGNPVTPRKPDRTVLLVTKPKSKILGQTNEISAN